MSSESGFEALNTNDIDDGGFQVDLMFGQNGVSAFVRLQEDDLGYSCHGSTVDEVMEKVSKYVRSRGEDLIRISETIMERAVEMQ